MNSLFVFRQDVEDPNVIARAFEKLFDIPTQTYVSCFKAICSLIFNKEKEGMSSDNITTIINADTKSITDPDRTVRFITYFPDATLDTATESIERLEIMTNVTFFNITGFFPDQKSFTKVVVSTRGAPPPLPLLSSPPPASNSEVAWPEQIPWMLTILSVALALISLLAVVFFTHIRTLKWRPTLG